MSSFIGRIFLRINVLDTVDLSSSLNSLVSTVIDLLVQVDLFIATSGFVYCYGDYLIDLVQGYCYFFSSNAYSV